MPRRKPPGTAMPQVIRTKFGPPRAARQTVARGRAMRLLELGSERVLTLLRAPAGFGKTTVLADWRGHLQAAHRPVAWVTLDEDDNDPSSFVSYVVRALGEALGSLADHAPELHVDPEDASPKVAITSVINVLDAIDVPVTLILDDYDRIQASAIHDLMSFLLLHAPHTLHVVIAVRAEPPLPLAYLRAHDMLVEIDVAQLRFTFEDTRAFFDEIAALKLETDVVRSLHDATEGWVAGMQMAAISLRDRCDPLPAMPDLPGSRRTVNDYLASAVLPGLDAGTVDTLMRLSILERFNGALSETVTGSSDGAATLRLVQQQNYFLQSLDDEHHWFRFHALFRDFLRTELALKRPDEITVLHQRAAAWFARQELWAEAVRHALAADQLDLAAQWVEHCAMREVEDSRVHTLLAWVRKLPPAAVARRHRLRLAVAWALLLTIQLDAAMAIVDDLERLLRRGDLREPQSFALELLALRFCVTALKDDTAAALPLGEQFLARMREGLRFEEHAVWAMQATLNGLTHCYQKAGRLDEARAMQQLDLYPVTRDRARNLFTQCYRATTLGGCDVREGRLHEAARRMREALTLAERHAGRRSAAATLVACSLASVHYEWNDLDAVDQLLADRLDIIDEACYLDSVRSAYLSLTRLAIVRGAYDSAHALLDRAELVASRRGWVRLGVVCLSERVRLHLIEGHPLEAETACARLTSLTAAHAPESVSTQSEVWRVRGIARARCQLQQGKAEAAVAELTALLTDVVPTTGAYPDARIRALLCGALVAAGRTDTARAQWDSLVRTGIASGMVRSIADDGAAIAGFISQTPGIVRSGRREAAAWWSTLSAALADDLAMAQPAVAVTPVASSHTLIEPLSKRERDVLTLVAQGLSNEQTARALQLGAETVKWHLKNVYSKLGVSRRTLAVHRARQMALISDDPDTP